MMNDQVERIREAFIIHHSTFLIILVAWLAPALVSAQVVRLPAVTPEEQSPPGQLVSHPDSSAQILQAPGEGDVAPATHAAGRADASAGRAQRRVPESALRRHVAGPRRRRRHGHERSAIAGDLRVALPDARFAAGDYARLRRALPARAATRRSAAAIARRLRRLPLALAGDAHAGARSGHHARHLQRLQPGQQQGVPLDRPRRGRLDLERDDQDRCRARPISTGRTWR